MAIAPIGAGLTGITPIGITGTKPATQAKGDAFGAFMDSLDVDDVIGWDFFDNDNRPWDYDGHGTMIAGIVAAALDGTGITSVTLEMVAPYLARGDLVRVLSPWITGRLVMYAALPSRKFIPQRSRVFLDYLMEQTREQSLRALEACSVC